MMLTLANKQEEVTAEPPLGSVSGCIASWQNKSVLKLAEPARPALPSSYLVTGLVGLDGVRCEEGLREPARCA